MMKLMPVLHAGVELKHCLGTCIPHRSSPLALCTRSSPRCTVGGPNFTTRLIQLDAAWFLPCSHTGQP